MENKIIELKLTKEEIALIQISLAQYIINNKNNIETNKYTENAKNLINNIIFYKRQINE